MLQRQRPNLFKLRLVNLGCLRLKRNNSQLITTEHNPSVSKVNVELPKGPSFEDNWRPAHVQNSMIDRLLVTTLNKLQNLLGQDCGVDEVSFKLFNSRIERSTLSNTSFVSFLGMPISNIPPYIEREMRGTYDSHLRLEALISHPPSYEIPPQAYLSSYLKVRYNLNQMQLYSLVKHLLYHNWYMNASILLLENSRTVDELLETTARVIESMESNIDINAFLINFQTTALVPQIVNWCNSRRIDHEIDFNEISTGISLKERISKIFQEQFGVIGQDLLVKSLGVEDDFPTSRLQLLEMEIELINRRKLSPNERQVQLTKLLENEFARDHGTMTAPGTLSKIIILLDQTDALDIQVLMKYISNFTLNGKDLSYLMSYNVTSDQLKEVYQYYLDSQLLDIQFIELLISRLIFYRKDDTLMEFMYLYGEDLSLYCIAKIFIHFRNDSKRFNHCFRALKRDQHGYVLTALGRMICAEYHANRAVTFEQILSLVDLLKCFKVNHVSYLKPIFEEVILDEKFITANAMNFEENLIKFSGSSRVNLELLLDWNNLLLAKYTDTGDVIFHNLVFNRKLLLRIMKLGDDKRRSKLLQTFGGQLAILESNLSVKFINDILNTIELERGRNSLKINRVLKLMPQLLEGYIERSMASFNSVNTKYKNLLFVLKNIHYIKDEQITFDITHTAKVYLMELTTEHNPHIGATLIKEEKDIWILRGHLLGVLSTDRLTSDEKVKMFDDAVKNQFYRQGFHVIGRKVITKLGDVIIEKLQQGEINLLTKRDRLLWTLEQCKVNKVHSSKYALWHQHLETMKLSHAAYWSGVKYLQSPFIFEGDVIIKDTQTV